uniref:Putative secreted protein n=1 Tax=Xenopsylla cheopis TaxID=163159 RepID=A0A6M2E1X8_XENCH
MERIAILILIYLVCRMKRVLLLVKNMNAMLPYSITALMTLKSLLHAYSMPQQLPVNLSAGDATGKAENEISGTAC